MINKTFISSLILILLTWSAFADGNESLFALANQKYSDGQYKEAAQSYEEIINSGYSSAALYYNLGNACYKQNELTRAILNFERALLLAPGDEDIKYNLDIANQLVVDKINSLPQFFVSKWYRQLRIGLSPDQWAWLSLSCFLLSGIFALLFLFLRSRFLRKLFLAAGIILLLISTSSLIFGQQQEKQFSERNTAIIFSPSVTAKSSPDDGGTDLFVLHEGVKVWIIDQLNGWLEIELADGNKAWIPGDSLERI
jgi:tetratricopeptide (TPR) repeat protein